MGIRRFTLGTVLRHLIALLDGGVEQGYIRSGLDYHPRYTSTVQTLLAIGPSSIRTISRHSGLTHSAISQTVAQMEKDGLITFLSGDDARERIVSLTPKAEAMVPVLKERWAATNLAAQELDKELSMPLLDLLHEVIAVLESRSFAERIEQAEEKLKEVSDDIE